MTTLIFKPVESNYCIKQDNSVGTLSDNIKLKEQGKFKKKKRNQNYVHKANHFTFTVQIKKNTQSIFQYEEGG